MPDDTTPRIDLRLLRQFVAVAEELHFRRAATRLAMSQPPLTAALRRLETEIGATLLERNHKTVKLTPAGQVLLDEARRLLAAAHDAIAATRDTATGKRGRVRLGYVGSAMYGRLPAAIRQFRIQNPGVRIELRELTTSAQLAALHAGALDLAIVVAPLADAAGLETTPFDTGLLAIALPASHHHAAPPALAVAALANEPFILWPRDQGPGFHDHVLRLCTAAGFTPEVAQEAHAMHAVLSLVAAGAGVAIVPANMSSIRPGEIVFRPIDDEKARFSLLLCRRLAPPEPATAALEAALRR